MEEKGGYLAPETPPGCLRYRRRGFGYENKQTNKLLLESRAKPNPVKLLPVPEIAIDGWVIRAKNPKMSQLQIFCDSQWSFRILSSDPARAHYIIASALAWAWLILCFVAESVLAKDELANSILSLSILRFSRCRTQRLCCCCVIFCSARS